MMLPQETVDTLKEVLPKLRREYLSQIIEDVCLALWNGGIRWEIAIQALEIEEPPEFIAFYRHYSDTSYEECKTAVENVDAELLASLIAYESRYLSHWSYGYSKEVKNFFIAGIERLLELNQ